MRRLALQTALVQQIELSLMQGVELGAAAERAEKAIDTLRDAVQDCDKELTGRLRAARRAWTPPPATSVFAASCASERGSPVRIPSSVSLIPLRFVRA